SRVVDAYREVIEVAREQLDPHHASFAGEFDCVADEVDEDLTHAQRVANHLPRKIRSNIGNKLQIAPCKQHMNDLVINTGETVRKRKQANSAIACVPVRRNDKNGWGAAGGGRTFGKGSQRSNRFLEAVLRIELHLFQRQFARLCANPWLFIKNCG